MLTGVLYIVAMLFNISGVMPLVWVSLVVIGFLGAAAPPDELRPRLCVRSGGLRQGQQRGVPPDQHHLHVQLRRQRLIKKLFNSLSVAYIVFAGLAFLSILLILALQDHKYDQDYMAAHKQ